jgi:ribose transport system ATP-binding protein
VEDVTTSSALHLTGLSKRFGGARALHEVELSLARGEVHGLVGANGSGKSTLVKILAGYHSPDGGSMTVWDTPVPLPITDASGHGIATIHQDLGLVDSLPIVENVVERSGFGRQGARPINWREQRRRVAALLERLGIPLDPAVEVASLTRGERTLVAMARAICVMEEHAGGEGGTDHLLVMDEPTAALSTTEAKAVYELLRGVAERGGAGLFISHHIQEVRSVCDRVTVLRDGQVVGTYASAETTEAGLVEAMLGAELARATPLEPGSAPAPGPDGAEAPAPVLRVDGIRTELLRDLSFDVGPGEVLGITGLLGMGQDELPYVVYGARPRRAGEVTVEGAAVAADLLSSLDAGVVLVPAERRRDGLWMEASATENMGIVATRRFWRRGRYDRAEERRAGRELAKRFDLVPRDPEAMAQAFSGGNQQRVLLAKWLQLEPRVVLLHEPTQGVDAGAKLAIHRLVREFARRTGAAVVVCSSDHVEVAELCDRVLVMARGRITAELRPPELSTHRILEIANAVEAT